MKKKYDFSGWATRNDLVCGDGRVIKKDAFKDCDGKTVSLVWNHDHDHENAVLGHAILENRDDGVYCYGFFNETEEGQRAKKLVQHGDVSSLSIWANKLKQNGQNVVHGIIRELSLVLSGANPGAYIDCVMAHSDDGSEYLDELYAGYNENIVIHHYDMEESTEEKSMDNDKTEKVENEKVENTEEISHADSERTIGDVLKTMNDEQKKALYVLVEEALSKEKNEEKTEEEKEMKHNVFDKEEKNEAVLSHDAMQVIMKDAKRLGSLGESFLAHSAEYGIENIDYLFPEAKTMNPTPEFIKRDTDWVSIVMNGVHHTPFSRVKSVFADITEDEARAKGYIKGNFKKEEVFTLLKRTTTPCTVYKKQKFDRDDLNDIIDMDVVAWVKSEMRLMLDEEIARAVLIGDGRLTSDDDHINASNIRPIWTDEDLFTIKTAVTVAAAATDDQKAKAMIKAAVKSRKNYRGSGNPVFFTTEDFLTDALLLEDTQGYRLYKSVEELATAMRVSRIVTVPQLENQTRVDSDSNTRTLMGLIVNLNDYNVGADKGGAVNMFDDFDIDYNQQKYLIEARCSGALVKPYSAIALEMIVSA